MSVAIKVENLSKAYQLGQIGTGTISKDLERWYALLRGKEDPFLKIGETNDQRSKSTSDLVWSLKDINFEIEQGDAVGIIGRNGAGKSTLLKIFSKVTAPTTGRITGKGRIASLLEVGTGFHPELSGRENIFLNGAILGMRKKEIQRKLEEIVDFAGIERYLDTPVKRYSSGMYVRLAFAVAAHLESEILIVDEVLAVGDAEFQKKCLGKMSQVSKGEGRTVLFVSHNMGSIQQLCNTSIFLQSGKIKDFGQTSKIISNYLNDANKNESYKTDVLSTKTIQLTNAKVIEQFGNNIIIELIVHSKISKAISIDLRVHDFVNTCFAFASLGAIDRSKLLQVEIGFNSYKVGLNVLNLALGNYSICIDLTEPNKEYYDRVDFALAFEIVKSTNSLASRFLRQDWNYGAYQMDIKLIND